MRLRATFHEYELTIRRRLKTIFNTFQESNRAASKPEVEITSERKEMATRFQRLTLEFFSALPD